MTLTLILDDEYTGIRLQSAFADVSPEAVVRLPPSGAPEAALTRAVRSRLCVGPEVGRQFRLAGWRDGMIFALTRQQFERARPMLGPRDSLLFHDVSLERLRSAARLALLGLTLFPPDLAPRGGKAAPVLEGFAQLTGDDRKVMSELVLGISNLQIAARLGRSPERVRHSVNRIFRKLGCLNRTEVAVLAYGRLSPFLELPRIPPSRTQDRISG